MIEITSEKKYVLSFVLSLDKELAELVQKDAKTNERTLAAQVRIFLRKVKQME